MIDYAYDALSRRISETWYDDVEDADAQQNARKTYSTTYDVASRVASVGDGEYDFAYTYSIFGNLSSTTQDLYGLTDDVVFSYAFDVLGRKTSASAKVGTTDDYVNRYAYDNLGRITQITQHGVSGGNAVAEKRIDFGYGDDGRRATISRFADLAGTIAVAETENVFDNLGRVTDIIHERAATEFADYDLTWDAASRISDFDFTSLVGDDGAADYDYDDTNQLTGADYDFQSDESYTYDANGNRTNAGYSTGDHNRLTSDGTYNYTYDNEGNVTSKTSISTSESVEYTWDHRNRLVKVTFKNSGGTPTKIVEYAYDHGQRWVRKTLDTNADQTIEESRIFIHDAGQIVLDFQKTGTSAATNSDLAHRYLFGANVDQLLADETVDDATADDVAWALTDHLNSVRDLVVYDPTPGTVSVVKHLTYDAYGNVTSDTATGVKSLFLYTARAFDADSGLQNNLNRWYDLSTGRWMSEDPIGYQSAVNLYAYVANAPSHIVDPLGLACKELTGIEYIAGRGSFKSAMAGKYTAATPGHIGADFYAAWQPDATQFADANVEDCSCCRNIGWIQVVRVESDWSGWGGWFHEKLNNGVFADGGVPYPGSITISGKKLPSSGNPSKLTTPIHIGDQPDRPTSYSFPFPAATLETFNWKAESCVTCLDGHEGPGISYGGITGGSAKLDKMAIYGCVRWEFSVERKEDGTYQYKSGPSITAVGVGPSEDFTQGVKDWYLLDDSVFVPVT